MCVDLTNSGCFYSSTIQHELLDVLGNLFISRNFIQYEWPRNNDSSLKGYFNWYNIKELTLIDIAEVRYYYYDCNVGINTWDLIQWFKLIWKEKQTFSSI